MNCYHGHLIINYLFMSRNRLIGDSRFFYLKWPHYQYLVSRIRESLACETNQYLGIYSAQQPSYVVPSWYCSYQTLTNYSDFQLSNKIDTYQRQWKSCNALPVSSRQLCPLPSDEERQRLLSMWEACHFESNTSPSHACNAHCPHGSFVQSYGVHDLPLPTSLQANANLRPNAAHSRAPSEWAWLELLVEKLPFTSDDTYTKCSGGIFSSKAELVPNSPFAGVCPGSGPSAIFGVRCSLADTAWMIHEPHPPAARYAHRFPLGFPQPHVNMDLHA